MGAGGPSAKAVVRQANKSTAQQLTQLSETERAAEFAARWQQQMTNAGPSQIRIVVCRATEVDKSMGEQVLDLCRLNMKNLYEQTPGGWDEAEKRDELFDGASRFILIVGNAQASPSPLSPTTDTLMAFVNWRFDVEECHEEDPCARPREDVVEVAYCYELQVHPSNRRLGLGSLMIEMLESIARASQMRKVMLTVFEDNREAVDFYRRVGYLVDRISPTADEQQRHPSPMGHYQIMSKAMGPLTS